MVMRRTLNKIRMNTRSGYRAPKLRGKLLRRTGWQPVAPQIPRIASNGYAIFFRNRNAQKTKSKIDIPISTARFGQYSKKCAPRRMIARISAMK
jgi:hypothetical protein